MESCMCLLWLISIKIKHFFWFLHQFSSDGNRASHVRHHAGDGVVFTPSSDTDIQIILSTKHTSEVTVQTVRAVLLLPVGTCRNSFSLLLLFSFLSEPPILSPPRSAPISWPSSWCDVLNLVRLNSCTEGLFSWKDLEGLSFRAVQI